MISTERESTIYARWPLTVHWGDVDDLVRIQVAAVAGPTDRPSEQDWVDVEVVGEEDPRYRDRLDVIVLVGPAGGERPAELTHDGVGDYSLWTRWSSTSEHVESPSAVWEVT